MNIELGYLLVTYHGPCTVPISHGNLAKSRREKVEINVRNFKSEFVYKLT